MGEWHDCRGRVGIGVWPYCKEIAIDVGKYDVIWLKISRENCLRVSKAKRDECKQCYYAFESSHEH